MRQLLSIPFLAALGAQHATALSLYIPFTDPQAVTADIEGVDESGHTTWRMGHGVPSGSFTDDPGFTPLPSGTVIEGSTDVQFNQIATGSGYTLSVGGDCGINDGVALCTIVASGPHTLFTTTRAETITPIEVQVASSVAAGAAGASESSITAAGGSTVSPAATATSTSLSSSGAPSDSGPASTEDTTLPTNVGSAAATPSSNQDGGSKSTSTPSATGSPSGNRADKLGRRHRCYM
ncbi:hypothetical protein OH77DRAFT_1523989 [Trametes cingulata]|nr:hypothetical protein OH77DRAFT_1523989 [Trametes cingulata]